MSLAQIAGNGNVPVGQAGGLSLPRRRQSGGLPHKRIFRAGWPRELLALAGLTLASLATLWPLGLTNRILTGVDALTYFTPYWAYRMAELRAGHIPLWNPYLFLGVPFLANPQAAVLYPLHWPLSWLTPSQALIWSALLHVWLAAFFMYGFMRRAMGAGRLAAWLAAALFSLGGFTLARIENINQLNALAWLPALLWLYDETRRADGWRGRVRWGVLLALALAMQILAGHTQTAFVNLVGWGLFAISSPRQAQAGGLDKNVAQASGLSSPLQTQAGGLRHRRIFKTTISSFTPLLAIIPALLLCAGQLLPTLELNTLGLRASGLTFRQAVSFSLRPRLLAQSLLPPFGGGLAQAFGSEGYGEFVGYLGVAALILAALAAIKTLRRPRGPLAPILLAATGAFLALGAYNPLYYLLWRFVPGFDLFRAPTRWLALYALGIAALAGMGLEVAATCSRRARELTGRARWPLLLGLPLLLVLAAFQQLPGWRTAAGWLAAGALAVVLLALNRRWPHVSRLGLALLALGELWLGSRGLPFVQATAPAALSLRTAPAALLAATADQPPAGRDRFLSMSDIRFDPGDLAELRGLQVDRLPADAVERLVRAAKQTEVMAPNLSLLWQLPALDGYDGGMLPLHRYVELESLFLPPDRLLTDGRLAEQLRQTPEQRLLDLTGVRYVISDKQRDLWADDVYYDLEMPAEIAAGQALTFELADYPAFWTTAVGVVVEAAAPESGPPVEVIVDGPAGFSIILTMPPDARMPVRLRLPAPLMPTRITVRVPIGRRAGVRLAGLSLIDDRAGAHQSITVSPTGDFRRIHTGDVKVYERRAAAGRAWLVHDIQPAADDNAALALLRDPAFDQRVTAIVSEQPSAISGQRAATDETVEVIAWQAERIVLRVRVVEPGLLVLADAFYPGWAATVNGRPAAILRTNLLFRGVLLAPGTQEVAFAYQPVSWHRGLTISLVALAALIAALLASCIFRDRRAAVV